MIRRIYRWPHRWLRWRRLDAERTARAEADVFYVFHGRECAKAAVSIARRREFSRLIAVEDAHLRAADRLMVATVDALGGAA